MGWRTAFGYDRPADIWREHARLTAYRNDGARLLDLRSKAVIGNDDYDAMAPFIWGGRPFADGRYSTPDGKARMIAVVQREAEQPLRDWPLVLNTGRYRDQWHTMTRTGLSPKLARHREEPLVEINAEDAAALGLEERALARVSTPQGETIFRVAITASQRRGEMFTPIHWTDQQSTGGRTGLLPRPLVDPHSGQPGFKITPARIEPVAVDWRGFLIVRGEAVTPACLWATRVSVAGGALFEIAGLGDAEALDAMLPKGERVEASDPARGTRRIAVLRDGKLVAALFVTRTGELPSRDWLISQLDQPQTLQVLAGRAPGAREDAGPVACVCFGVGLRSIVKAIRDQQLADVPAIGAALGAGTNCGSCRPALAQILAAQTKEVLHA
jgi:assimilatory nitrate reductase catalytic subunit